MRRTGTATLLWMTLSVAVLTGCSSSPSPQPTVTISRSADSDAPSATAEPASCGQRTVPHPELAGQLPGGFPTLPGWQPTEVAQQGSTRVVRGALLGEPTELATVRDRAAGQLTGAGYRLTDTDEEPGYEAEAELAGPHEVNLNVKPLCHGYLVVSYLVRQ